MLHRNESCGIGCCGVPRPSLAPYVRGIRAQGLADRRRRSFLLPVLQTLSTIISFEPASFASGTPLNAQPFARLLSDVFGPSKMTQGTADSSAGSLASQIDIASQRRPRAAVGERSSVRCLLELHQHAMPPLERVVVLAEHRVAARIDPHARGHATEKAQHHGGEPERDEARSLPKRVNIVEVG